MKYLLKGYVQYDGENLFFFNNSNTVLFVLGLTAPELFITLETVAETPCFAISIIAGYSYAVLQVTCKCNGFYILHYRTSKSVCQPPPSFLFCGFCISTYSAYAFCILNKSLSGIPVHLILKLDQLIKFFLNNSGHLRIQSYHMLSFQPCACHFTPPSHCHNV